MTRTVLYRCYGDAGLLYLGITDNLFRRMGEHAASAWGDQITSSKYEYFPTRHAAETAEREAIQRENPVHNIRRIETPPPLGPQDGWRFMMLEQIKANGDTMRGVSKRAGLSHGYVHGILIDGKDPTIDKFMAVCAAVPMDLPAILSVITTHRAAS